MVVVRLANSRQIRTSTSIPTAATAAHRFEAAVLAADPSWFASGRLSDIHIGLLFFSIPDDLEERMALSMLRFSFHDHWAGTGHVELRAGLVSFPLGGIPSTAEALSRL